MPDESTPAPVRSLRAARPADASGGRERPIWAARVPRRAGWAARVPRRARVVVLFLAVIAVAGMLMVPAFDAPAPQLDEGLLVAFPVRLIDGSIPQRDFYDPYGVGSVVTVAAAYELLGESVRSERVVGMIYRLAIVAAAFGLALCWGAGAAVVGAGLVAATLVGSVGAPASVGFWSLALLGYALLARAMLRPSARSRTLIPLAGVLLAASLLMRADFLVGMVLACIPPLLVLSGGERRRFAAGFAAGLLPLLVDVGVAGPADVWRSLRIGLETSNHPARPPFGSDLAEAVALYMLATAMLLFAGARLERSAPRNPQARLLIGAGLWGLGMVPFALSKLDEGHIVISAMAELAMLPCAALVLVRGTPPTRQVPAASHAFALAAVAAVGFFACAEAIRLPVYHAAKELVSGAREPSYQVSGGGRSFPLADPAQAQQAQAMVAALDRLARPGDSLFVGPQDLRTAGTPNSIFLYFLLPWLKPASYFMDVDRHTINRPANHFPQELLRAKFLVLEAGPPAASASELGPPTANEIVQARFCVKAESGGYRLYERCR